MVDRTTRRVRVTAPLAMMAIWALSVGACEKDESGLAHTNVSTLQDGDLVCIDPEDRETNDCEGRYPGVISSVYGLAQLGRNTGPAEPAAPGKAFDLGDSIVTGRDSLVELRLKDGTLVRVGESSIFAASCAKLRPQRQSGGRVQSLSVADEMDLQCPSGYVLDGGVCRSRGVCKLNHHQYLSGSYALCQGTRVPLTAEWWGSDYYGEFDAIPPLPPGKCERYTGSLLQRESEPCEPPGPGQELDWADGFGDGSCNQNYRALTTSTLDWCDRVPPSCLEGYERCGDKCVDVSASRSHCGMCGNSCGEGQRCYEGACYAPHPDDPSPPDPPLPDCDRNSSAPTFGNPQSPSAGLAFVVGNAPGKATWTSNSYFGSGSLYYLNNNFSAAGNPLVGALSTLPSAGAGPVEYDANDGAIVRKFDNGLDGAKSAAAIGPEIFFAGDDAQGVKRLSKAFEWPSTYNGESKTAGTESVASNGTLLFGNDDKAEGVLRGWSVKSRSGWFYLDPVFTADVGGRVRGVTYAPGVLLDPTSKGAGYLVVSNGGGGQSRSVYAVSVKDGKTVAITAGGKDLVVPGNETVYQALVTKIQEQRYLIVSTTNRVYLWPMRNAFEVFAPEPLATYGGGADNTQRLLTASGDPLPGGFFGMGVRGGQLFLIHGDHISAFSIN